MYESLVDLPLDAVFNAWSGSLKEIKVGWGTVGLERRMGYWGDGSLYDRIDIEGHPPLTGTLELDLFTPTYTGSLRVCEGKLTWSLGRSKLSMDDSLDYLWEQARFVAGKEMPDAITQAAAEVLAGFRGALIAGWT